MTPNFNLSTLKMRQRDRKYQEEEVFLLIPAVQQNTGPPSVRKTTKNMNLMGGIFLK